MYQKNKIDIRKENENMKFEDRKIIKNTAFDYAVTFNTRTFMPKQTLEKYFLDEFERRLNKKLYGYKWRTKGSKIDWLHYVEHESNNTHSHSVCKISNNIRHQKFKKQAYRIWHKLNFKLGNLNAQLYIDNFDKPTAVANYITKDNYADFSFV